MTINQNQSAPMFEAWAKLELMGHRVLYGFVCEAEIAGAKFLKITVHEGEKSTGDQFYAPSSVYGIHPMSRELVVSASMPWEERQRLRALKPASDPNVQDASFDDHHEYDDSGDLPDPIL